MRKSAAAKFWRQQLMIITRGGGDAAVPNPAFAFALDAKTGKFDSVPEEEYLLRLSDVSEESSFWGGLPTADASEVFLNALSRTPLADNLIRRVAGALAEASSKCNYEPGEVRDIPDDWNDITWPDDEIEVDGHGNPRLPSSWTPREIYDVLCEHVEGQDEAKRAAATVMYHHLNGGRRNAVFCGPSGCGKSEIWRVLSRKFPGRIRTVDASRLSAEGWRGSVHVRDIFDGLDPAVIDSQGLIVVLDEADKVCCETIVSGNGTDHGAMIQNSLLKMLDGDVIEFGAEDKQPAFSVDCGKVSVVMLGAFETLLKRKSSGSGSIGFGGTPRVECGHGNADITHDDLIAAGMRREIAGRINRIVPLRPLSDQDYRAILCESVLAGLSGETGCEIGIDGVTATALAHRAAGTGLGVRWLRSQVRNAVDDAMFDAPAARGITLRLDGETGRLEGRVTAVGPKAQDAQAAIARAKSMI